MLFDENIILGKEEVEAIQYLKSNNIVYRISSRDNQHYILTRDYKPQRVNLSIIQGKVSKITMG